GLVAGQLSYILNSISAYRTAQATSASVADDIFFVPALKGPGGKGVASQHVVRSYLVPKWAANVDKIKQFLIDLVGAAHGSVYNAELYDFPAFRGTGAAAALPGWLQNDPFKSKPANKLALLADAEKWTTNVGFPGAANAAEGEIFDTNVLPTMMASAARGKATPKQAVQSAAKQCEAIFSKWRAKGLVWSATPPAEGDPWAAWEPGGCGRRSGPSPAGGAPTCRPAGGRDTARPAP